MDFPVPINAETDPINILLQPFDKINVSQYSATEEDVFWKMVNGEMDLHIKAAEDAQRLKDKEAARLASIEAQKALMCGGASGEVIYESLVRPSKSAPRGEFPLMKMSSNKHIEREVPNDPGKPIPRVATVPPKPVPVPAPVPPAQIEHKMDPFTKGLIKNADLHIHRTRHDPTNLYWSMQQTEAQ